MAKLDFIPHDEPQTDFITVATDTDDLRVVMTRLGATRIPTRNHTTYVWNRRLGKRFMFGMGVLDGRLIVGPTHLDEMPEELGAGSYTIVDLADDAAQVKPDPFGMNVTYISDLFITNRLHLAAIVADRIDLNAAITSLYNDGGFSFSFNAFQTPVSGVSILAAGASAIVQNGRVSVVHNNDESDYEPHSPEAYWRLIEKGAAEVVANVTAVASSGLPVFADITGGRDSRVVFGALVAAGLQDRVVFNTIANPSTPGLKADLEIGTGLVSRYGGSYSERPRAVGYAVHSVAQNIERRRSQVFGAYHWIVPSDIRPVSTLTKTPTIRMLGGGGELYREYWQPLLFTSADSNAASTPDEFDQLLTKHRGASLPSGLFPRYLSYLTTSLMALSGQTVGQKLDAHYLNFRNRFHFGPRQSSPQNMMSINVATAPSLLAAYRGLPAVERASGRVLFDVIRTLDEQLAFLPFDSPNDERIFDSTYHRPSRYQSSALTLDPAVELATDVLDTRNFQRAAYPTAEVADFEKTLDQEIDESIEIISSAGSPFSFLLGPELSEYVAWAKNHSPRNRSALASKLRAFADYSEYGS